MNRPSRRNFLKTSLGGTAGMLVLPNIFTGSLFAATSPNKQLQVAQIGCGRMGTGDMDGILRQAKARVVAVCDLDSKRAAAAAAHAEEHYKQRGEAAVRIRVYEDYREVLANPEIDAVVVSVPDHWHGLVAVAAAIAGKHIYVQKPLAYTIAEAIALRQAVLAKKVILQTGSQQRSENPFPAFRPASEAVRNGRIGKLQTIKIGVGIDKPSGKPPAPMPVPPHLNFERWLGPAPEQPYMEGRVHPQNNIGRPGWITTEGFGLGMITNWGAHHIDIAQWAMGQELGGPMIIDAQAEFMLNDVWTVHTSYHIEMMFPNEVKVILDNSFENGIHFEGSEGSVFCTRGAAKVTASDPNIPVGGASALRASKANILSPLGADAKRWPASNDHYDNWIESVLANKEPVAPVTQSARSMETCAAAWIGMKLKRKLTWDAAKEAFVGDDEANALRSRTPRKPEYDIQALMTKAGLA
ncbi:MAG: Gfo/Idh/MocA family oxidoreductase [Verrucomicrobiota bacterium]